MTIQNLREQNLIIFEGIVGSHAYGISTETSDVDKKGVFIQPLEDILSFGYRDQISDEKNDVVFYEVRRFLQLLCSNNPTVLELLFLPSDCIIHINPIFNLILEKRDSFLTKACRLSFGGYAIQQIRKARGLNKKIVKPLDKNKLSVLDFCYVPEGQGSISIREYLKERNMDQKFCGLSSIPHMRSMYSLFYDKASQLRERGVRVGGESKKYKGIVQDEIDSNDVSLSEIEKREYPCTVLFFNKDAYSIYCKEYREYWDWVENRNESRFTDNMVHAKGYDGKNLAHCHRLLDTAIEIAENKKVEVRRSNRETLLKIRRGEFDYEKLVQEAEEKMQRMDLAFEKTDLPEKVDQSTVNQLLLEIRKRRYQL